MIAKGEITNNNFVFYFKGGNVVPQPRYFCF